MLLYLCCHLLACGGGLPGLVVPHLAGVEARKVLDEARSAASQLLAEGRETGNALLVRASNEVTVMADNTTRLLGEEIDQTLEKLSEENQRMIAALDRLRKQTQSLSRDAFDFKDAVSLDLRSLLQTVPFVDSESFYIQRIDGVTQLQASEGGDYRLEIWGIGLGPNSEASKSQLSLRLAGKEVSEVIVQRTMANRALLIIPKRRLDGLFDKTKLKLVDTVVHVTRQVKKGWWLWRKWHTRKYEVPFKISLIPELAGNLEVEWRTPVREWVHVGTETSGLTTGNHHCKRKCRGERTATGYSLSIKVAGTQRTPPLVGDRRLSDAKVACVSGPCPWSRIDDHGTYSEHGTRITSRFTVWSKPTTWRLAATVHEYRNAGESSHNKTVPLWWGSTAVVEVDSDASYVRMRGTTLNGTKIDLVVGTVTQSGPVTIAGVQRDDGGPQRIVLQVARPD